MQRSILLISIFALTAVCAASPGISKHGKVITKQGVRNPHAKTVQHGTSTDPKVTITSPHGKVRVDTKDGPIFIGQIGPNNGRGEDGRGDPYPRCLLCHADIENVTKNMAGMNLYCDFCHGLTLLIF